MIRYWSLRFRLFYYELALKQIDPLHPDVPFIVTTINQIRSELCE